MTALQKYQRLEASGLWRATPEAQRQDVIVSIGDATLLIADLHDRPLTHWSLAALERLNPGELPALYCPYGDPGETLELAENETEMVAAIEKIRTAIGRGRAHPGRLRMWGLLGSVLVVLGLGAFWLPMALRAHAVTVVPTAKRAEIGAALGQKIKDVTGPPCNASSGNTALERLATRLTTGDGPLHIEVMRGGVRDAVALPGGTILVNRALVEDYEEPDVLAGYILAERLRARQHDPLADLLAHAGILDSLRFLTTGDVPVAVLDSYARQVLTSPRPTVDDDTLLTGFSAYSVRARPYAYAVDITGEKTIRLIEADPFATLAPPALLSDADWLRLQGICAR